MNALGTSQPWMAQARCAGKWYFTELPVPEQQAECRECPVRLDCAEYGLGEPYIDQTDQIVWGGMAPRERFDEKKKQRRERVVIPLLGVR